MTKQRVKTAITQTIKSKNNKTFVSTEFILEDNFAYIIHDQKSAVLVDPGEFSSIDQFLIEHSLTPVAILITHHHFDHIGGLREFQKKYPLTVYAPLKNKDIIKTADVYLKGDEELTLLNEVIKVIAVNGHTHGHLAYHFINSHWLFSGDVVFALGCGRVFEGTFEEMFLTLQKIKNLTDTENETFIFTAHDYYLKNKSFCDSENIDTLDYQVQYPLSLSEEIKFNPFLKAINVETFSHLRAKRNLH